MAICKSASTTNLTPGVAAGDGMAEAERALALDPNLGEAHAAKAKILVDRGELDASQKEADAALALEPQSRDANSAAATCALMGRRYAEAIRYYEAASAADEQDGASPFMSMQCYEALGDHEGAKRAGRTAIERLEKAIAVEPDNGGLMAFGVGALVLLGDVDRARDWTRHALMIDPEDSNLHYNLACAMTRLRDFDYALELLGAAFQLSDGGIVTWAREDSDLDPLRDDPRFQAAMAKGEKLLAAKTV
jgi:adenylate cyclase